jgi:hypothetical protein
MGDLPAWISACIAFVIGAGGLGLAFVANSRAAAANVEAAKSNAIAEAAKREAIKANAISADALNAADKANRIAGEANKLSEEANALVGRSVAAQTEDWHVDWRIDWNKAAGLIVLKNRGRDAAFEVSVTVTGEGIYKVQTFPDGVPPNTDQTIEVFEILELRREADAATARRLEANRGSRVTVFPTSFSLILKVSIHWRTGEGFPADHAFNLTAH